MSTLIDRNGRIVKLSGQDDPTVKLAVDTSHDDEDGPQLEELEFAFGEMSWEEIEELEDVSGEMTHPQDLARKAEIFSKEKGKKHPKEAAAKHQEAAKALRKSGDNKAADKHEKVAKEYKSGGDKGGTGGGSSGGANQYGPY